MERYYPTVDADWYRKRLIGVMVVASAAFAVLFIRLFYIQVVNGEEYRRLSENNCIRLQTLDAPRGLIFDRNMDRLVENRPSFDLSIIVKDAQPLADTIKKLAQYTRLSEAELVDVLRSKKKSAAYKPILLKQDIGRDALAAIEVHRFDLPGVIVDAKPRRNYIHQQTAAHVLGYMSQINSGELRSGKYPKSRSGDFIGKYGAEKTFENLLSGERGGQQVEVDATGQTVSVLKIVAPRPGHNIFATLDLELQKKAEKLLEGVAGAVAAIDPATGQVLALASSPSFDQNFFVDGMTSQQWEALRSNPKRPLTSKAIQGVYPPASTYKIITAMAGLEEKVIDEQTAIHCNGYYRYGNRVYRCWKKSGHGTVNVTQAIAQSCDVFFYQVGQRLGVDRLAWYARACGLGERTGIELDHESAGLVPTAAWKKKRFGQAWQGGETLSIAIGQGFNLVTPLQMAVMTAAVGLDGNRLQPRIMKKIETVEGDLVEQSQVKKVGKLPASEHTLSLLRQGLWAVVNERTGTAWHSRLPDWEMSGKTGTAQVVSLAAQESYAEEDLAEAMKDHAWFVAYAPSSKPVIAVAVMVEHGEHGSSAAAPVAKQLIALYLEKVGAATTADKMARAKGAEHHDV